MCVCVRCVCVCVYDGWMGVFREEIGEGIGRKGESQVEKIGWLKRENTACCSLT